MLYPNYDYENRSIDELKEIVALNRTDMENDPDWQLGRELFVNISKKTGKVAPWEMYPGELAIFKLITHKQYKYSQILCSTQYGKTFTVARAVLTRITTYPEDWLIVVPDMKRGKIFLDQMVQDTSNSKDYFAPKLVGKDLGDRTALNKLLEEKSKTKLTYQVLIDGDVKYGSVTLITTEARRKYHTIETVMGFGGDSIIEEEGSLVDDNIDAGIFRMLAGKPEQTSFLCKIGNPFRRNHFYKSWIDPDYKKIFIDYKIGLAEGAYKPDHIKKSRDKPQFSILYECKFPSADSVDEQNYTVLLTESELNSYNHDVPRTAWMGELRLGVDVAGGGADYNVFVIRCGNYATVLRRFRSNDTTFVGNMVKEFADKYKIKASNVFVDDIGVGLGVTSTLKHLKFYVNAIKVGRKASSSSEARFRDQKAQNYWRVRTWLHGGGRLDPTCDWTDLLEIKYRRSDANLLEIKSKKEMRAESISSPDTAEALMLTFARPDSGIEPRPFISEKKKIKGNFDPQSII